MDTRGDCRELVLVGSIAEVIHPRVCLDQEELVMLVVEGAVPLWAELRLPNRHGWALGERVSITIAPNP